MRSILTFLIDVYLAAVVLDWALTSTQFQVKPWIKIKVRIIVEPLLEAVQNLISPSYGGTDLSRITAIVLLFAARATLLALF